MVGAATGRHNAGEGAVFMARKQHSIEFQDEACKLVTEQGYSQQEAADKLGITRMTMGTWLKKRGHVKPVEIVEPDYASSDDPKLLKSRIRELQKQLARAETEREILKKATAYFASQSQ
jgi:transposase